MTQINTVNVPRESLHTGGLGSFAKVLTWFRNVNSKKPNNRMVKLPPHILRDIGILDGKSIPK